MWLLKNLDEDLDGLENEMFVRRDEFLLEITF
jgi:hypothetical protein